MTTLDRLANACFAQGRATVISAVDRLDGAVAGIAASPPGPDLEEQFPQGIAATVPV